jgi:hypothetical protein
MAIDRLAKQPVVGRPVPSMALAATVSDFLFFF